MSAQAAFPEYADHVDDDTLALMHALVANATALRPIIMSRSITPALLARLPAILRACHDTSGDALTNIARKSLKAGQAIRGRK